MMCTLRQRVIFTNKLVGTHAVALTYNLQLKFDVTKAVKDKRFWVRVPVSSEEILGTLLRVSTAGRVRIIAFYLAILVVAAAKVKVTAA